MSKAKLIILMLFASLWVAEGQERVPQILKTQTEWVRLSPTSVVKFRRALEPKSGKPYCSLPELRGQLRREFRLPQKKLELHAPLLVEYRVESADWEETIGGNYRGSGRDENFAFLLRDQDGHWLPDRYGQVMMFGGLSVKRKVSAEESFSYWHSATRWTHPERAGKYELHCLVWDNAYTVLGREKALAHGLGPGLENVELDIDFQNGPHVPSPLALPVDLQTELERRQRDTSELVTYGRFDLEFVEESKGTNWIARVSEEAKSWPDNKAQAIQIGLWFVPGTRFMPLLESRVTQAGAAELTGLALNPNPEAIELLMKGKPFDVLSAIYRLRPEHRGLLRAWLEEMTESSDESQATSASQYLKHWYGGDQ